MLRNILSHPLTRDLDLDSPETTELRRQIIQSKPFLKKIYEEWYDMLISRFPDGNLKRVFEIGSGAGFLGQVAPDVISSDLLHIAGVDLVMDAQCIPAADEGLHGLLMVNVLHHIPDTRSLFREASRSLEVGGMIVMIEPWLTTWSRMVYTKLHHEPLDDQAAEWKIQGEGPLSGANSALPWIVFHRDLARFQRDFPEWEVREVRPFMPLRYLLSGGISLRNLMPGFSFGFWRLIETLLTPLNHHISMFAIITLQKRSI